MKKGIWWLIGLAVLGMVVYEYRRHREETDPPATESGVWT